jgi:hypothetical protein
MARMRTIRSFLVPALAAVALLSGCGGEARDATSKELAALTAEISKLRAQQAAIDERLGAIERGKSRPPATEVVSAAGAEGAPPSPAQRSLDGDRPSLDVVKLGPSAEAPEEGESSIDDEGPRTVLRSGANGIVVEETGPGGAARVAPDGSASSKKVAAKKSDKVADRKKTASVPTP